MIVSGIATSPTAGDVRYILKVNGNVVLDVDHQLAPDLWTLYPIRIKVETGPARVELLCVSTTAVGVLGTLGRLAGWKLSGNDVEPRRVVR